ncbi:hormogonium polysaccharide secretion pseudopilin HpsC [Calothrix sp. 336/3]|uniref:hormogonium polysaccharide secretion pseudopilin HpsC n=1 Tax=Calothrix sp. 336/3 TaxID=1337936 RepID=UPI0004E35F55|nr:hormogonium polysaccharide secretion pseudopilin HpsC [Calothrix sp. 336/3]AKG23335.1 hypothetical protein IJ00_20445 [Calothrix sp. 336/3]
MNIWKWLLVKQLQAYRKCHHSSGFTMLELLVAMVLAVLVITPLMLLMINILNTDRQEQAKANSEQEIQAAIEYINRDLQQSIYIYDNTGVNAIKTQLPTVTNGNPVLVFWKREFRKDKAVTTISGTTFNDDTFVYSLVAYYLVKDDAAPWSKAARISRFQIKDGVLNKNGSTCTGVYDTTNKFTECPDPGFKPFNLQVQGTLQTKMNAWTKHTSTYTQKAIALVDFVDHSSTSETAPTASCPTGFSTITPTSAITGFYACVNSVSSENRSVAEVYLRGNALARLSDNSNDIKYTASKVNYFPVTKVRTQGLSFLFTK